MTSILIKDTTREERQQIVDDAIGNISASCDGCAEGIIEMYKRISTARWNCGK